MITSYVSSLNMNIYFNLLKNMTIKGIVNGIIMPKMLIL